MASSLKPGLHIEGAKEIVDALNKFPPTFQKKAVRPATRAGAKIVKQDMEIRVPEDEGILELSIRTKAAPRSRTRFGTNILVGSDDIDDYSPYYALFVEFGTEERRHKTGKYTGRITPRPFARPSLWENVNAIHKRALEVMKQKLPEIVKQVAAQAHTKKKRS